MRVFKPVPAERAELAHPLDPSDFETINSLANGSARAQSWRPLPFILVSEDQGEELEAVDMPWLGSHTLVLKRRARDALESTLRAQGELLPLASTPELWLFNPANVLDALDRENSEVTCFSNGRVMRVLRPIFKPDRIGQHLAFKIPDLRVSPVFVTEALVDLCKATHLTGTEFSLVWQSS